MVWIAEAETLAVRLTADGADGELVETLLAEAEAAYRAGRATFRFYPKPEHRAMVVAALEDMRRKERRGRR